MLSNEENDKVQQVRERQVFDELLIDTESKEVETISDAEKVKQNNDNHGIRKMNFGYKMRNSQH